jgi:hypothetical protein
VIGADGTDGANCDLSDYYCLGGDGSDGESVTASGNPAVAYGGNGGAGGLDGGYYIGSGNGGAGGSATAVAEASAASGSVTASATAVGGAGGWSYFGPSVGGDASATATAISGDVSVYSTAVATGLINGSPGGYLEPQASASAFAEALPFGNVPEDGEIVFGIAILGTEGFGFNDVSQTYASLSVAGYRGNLFLDAFNLGPGALIPGFGPFETGVAVYGPGTFVLYGTVPEPSTWAMMLIGFAGLGFAGHRSSRARRAA